MDRKPKQVGEYGYDEPEAVPVGKITIKQTMELLSMHRSDPQKYTSLQIANNYKLDEETVKTLLDNFKIFQLHLPKNSKAADMLASSGFRTKESLEGGPQTNALPDTKESVK